MGSGWSQASGCSNDVGDLDITQIGKVASSSGSSYATSSESLSLSTPSFSQESTKEAHPADEAHLEVIPEEPSQISFVAQATQEITMMEGIRRAIAVRDQKWHQLNAVTMLHDSLRYEVDKANYDLNVLNQQYQQYYGQSPFAEEGQPRTHAGII